MNKINEARLLELLENDYDNLTDEEYDKIISFLEDLFWDGSDRRGEKC